MRRLSIRHAAIFVAVFSVSGCITTRGEGQALRADVDALKAETASLQRELNDGKTKEGQRLESIAARMDALEGTLGQLRQADADSGVQLEKVIAEVQTLRGDIETARHEIGETSASVQSILARPPVSVAAAAQAPKAPAAAGPQLIDGAEVPAEAKAHYDFAKKLFDEKKFPDAADAFDLFMQRHSDKKDLLDNAAFWKAESYYGVASALTDQKAKEKALKQAILAYQVVLEDTKSEKADSALYKIGLAFEQLGFKEEAAVFYDELISKHATSPLVGDAKKRLKQVGGVKKKKAGK